MKINPKKCVACGNCTYVCPMGAIYVDPELGRSTINRDECVECYSCYNGLSAEALPPVTVRLTRKFFREFALRFEPEPDICPTSAFEPDELEWPRVVRRAFSDPRVPHESTGVSGRGTEEVKTNDVTKRVDVGEVGFTIEFGRPGVGARFRDIQEMSRALAAAGVSFEKNNPIATLMTDTTTGDLRPDILNEKVMSAILEIKVPVARTEEVVRIVWEVEKHLDTIIVMGVGTRCDENGEENVVAPVLERLGYKLVRAKTNMGLGRKVLRELAPSEKTGADEGKKAKERDGGRVTNTLHRFGSAESFRDDIIVIAVPAKGSKSGQGDSLPALRRFLEIAMEYKPVNVGDALHGGALRPTRTKNFFGHWFKRNKPDPKKVLETMNKSTTTAAVFDNLPAAQAFVKRIKEEDFGVSINISTSIENAKSCCKAAGVPRHSVGYSLGFEGMGDNIPNKHAIMLATMCGHGMIAQSFAKKMIDFVKENRRSPDEAVASLQRFCSCGIFNPTRAHRIIEDAKIGAKD